VLLNTQIMGKLKEIQELFNNNDISIEVALIKAIDFVGNSHNGLNKKKLAVENKGNGVYHFTQKGKFVCEGDKAYCQEKSFEILIEPNQLLREWVHNLDDTMNQPVERLLDFEVIDDIYPDHPEYHDCPIDYKNIYSWCKVSDGKKIYAVGFNENPATGHSYPIKFIENIITTDANEKLNNILDDYYKKRTVIESNFNNNYSSKKMTAKLKKLNISTINKIN
jgi:hypothetical protein